MQHTFAPFALLTFVVLMPLPRSNAEPFERFVLPQETQAEMWRLTNNPSRRDWANYHIRNCWSPDGRYVCTTRGLAYHHTNDDEAAVRVFDLQTGKTTEIPDAGTPRWAHHSNWLFCVQKPEGYAKSPSDRWHIIRWDADTGQIHRLQGYSRSLGSTDSSDRWVYASSVIMPDGRGVPGARVPTDGGAPEPLPVGGQLDGNPEHPRIFTRVSNYFRPFKPTRILFDADGRNIGVASPCLQQCHQSWSGGGGWYLFGNQPMAGRRWNEPFPSNKHVLSVMTCGDICRGAKTDRYLVGSGATREVVVADLRSGGGWVVVPEALSFIHDSPHYQYSGDSALFDNDAKGSPDGTKICFVSTYDLKDGPITHTSKQASAKTGPGIHVQSTEGFPAKGRLSIRSEVIGYERKTETTFEGLTRGMYGTTPRKLQEAADKVREQLSEFPADIRAGWTVTSFEGRLIPEDLRQTMPLPSRFSRDDYPDRDSPLLWQRRTDVYVAIARKPDAPWLRPTDTGIELIPGELHFETRGYRILRNGTPISEALTAPGTNIPLPAPGNYTAIATEHSGLTSAPSNALQVKDTPTLNVLEAATDDFSWTEDRWTADRSIREIVHRVDGVIHREWYVGETLVKRHDLDEDGNAIRRLAYTGGQLARREYHTARGEHITTEVFDADGFITESMRNRKRQAWAHWWFVKGSPVKHWSARGGHHSASTERGGTYMKQGIRWVKVADGKP